MGGKNKSRVLIEKRKAMKKLIISAALVFSSCAVASPWMQQDAPQGSPHWYSSRAAYLLAKKETCENNANIYKRLAGYRQNGLNEHEAIQAQYSDEEAAGMSQPVISPFIIGALGKLYTGNKFTGLSPDQVAAQVQRDCMAQTQVPNG
ncbi:hypothetical protein JKG47_17970 [Acidithiobacillus sp. MC6.1]|nr:hypothetical protein [Acidithiobacillus sp. MC6.1]